MVAGISSHVREAEVLLSKTTAMKFRNFIRILLDHGFELDRQRGGSHRIYKGVVGGRTRIVVVACHRESDDIRLGVFDSMIRQSGLSKKLFR